MATDFYELFVFVFYSFLAAIVPSGGSLITTGLLSFAIPIDKAIGLTSAFFLVNGLIVVAVFRKHIVRDEVKKILFPAILGAFLGAYFLVQAPKKLLIALMFLFCLKFFYDKLKKKKSQDTKEGRLTSGLVGFLSGIVTGAGLPAGGIRNAYLLSRGHSIPEMHAIQSVVGVFVWIITVSFFLGNDRLLFRDFVPLLFAFPFLILSNYIALKALLKIPKKASDAIAFVLIGIVSIYMLYLLVA